MGNTDAREAVKLVVLEELIQEVEASLRQCRRTMEGLQQRIAIEERQRRLLMEKRNAIAHAHSSSETEHDFGTTADVVAKVLFERGAAMRVRDIVQALKECGLATGDQERIRNNVISTLSRREDMFDKISRGMYALKTWFEQDQQERDGSCVGSSPCKWEATKDFALTGK